jgi:predicted RNA-binding protein with PUA-like domain
MGNHRIQKKDEEEKFEKELIQEEIEINPDDIWDDIRNYLARKNSCISRWTSK